MLCPFCGLPDSHVLDTRATEEGRVIRRRRECVACTRRFTTYEKVETTPLMVIKKDGRREQFDVDKLRRSIVKACGKSALTADAIDALAAELETYFAGLMEREIATSRIGDMLLSRLREVDEVAYIRFASVYRSYNDIETFLRELNTMIGENR